jgi:hypothetical protein
VVVVNVIVAPPVVTVFVTRPAVVVTVGPPTVDVEDRPSDGAATYTTPAPMRRPTIRDPITAEVDAPLFFNV